MNLGSAHKLSDMSRRGGGSDLWGVKCYHTKMQKSTAKVSMTRNISELDVFDKLGSEALEEKKSNCKELSRS